MPVFTAAELAEARFEQEARQREARRRRADRIVATMPIRLTHTSAEAY